MGDNRKILIEIVTKTSGAEKKIKGVGNAADGAGKKAEGARKSFFGLGKTLGAIARGFIIVKGFQLLAQTISSTIKVAAEFELTMAKVKAISGATEEEFQKLTASARELALGTIFTASQVGELQLAYSKLGFTTDEILAATEATLQLATATGEDLAGAADVVGASIRGFGLAADDTQRVVDIMAKAFSSSALNLENFKQSMKTVAPIARAAYFDIETSSALLGKLADAGLRGTRAATGLKNLMSQLTDPTSELAKELGFTVKNSEGLMYAFRELSKRGIDLSKATGLVDERSKAAFITLVNGTAGVDDLRYALDNATGSAESMASIVSGTLIGSYKMLQSQIEETQIAITNSEFFKDFLDELSIMMVFFRDGYDEAEKMLVSLTISKNLEKDLSAALDAEKKFFKERKEQNKIFAEENKRIIDEVDDKKKVSDLLNQRSLQKTKSQQEELTQFRLSQIKLLEEKEKELKAERAEFEDAELTASIERVKANKIRLQENLSNLDKNSRAYSIAKKAIEENKISLEKLEAKREKETDSLKETNLEYASLNGRIEKVKETYEKLKTSTEDTTGRTLDLSKAIKELNNQNDKVDKKAHDQRIKNLIELRQLKTAQVADDRDRALQVIADLKLEKDEFQETYEYIDATKEKQAVFNEEFRKRERDLMLIYQKLVRGINDDEGKDFLKKESDKVKVAQDSYAKFLKFQEKKNNQALADQERVAAEIENWEAEMLQMRIDAGVALMQASFDMYQVLANNRMEAMARENEAEMTSFTDLQDEKLSRFDIDQQHELDTFIGTQQQKADFERQKGLERLEFEKQQQQEREALRKKQLKAENAAAKEAFKVEKANTLAKIAIQTALGIAQINANPTVNLDPSLFTLRALMTALITGTGAAQAAVVGAQKFQPKTFQDGGMIEGASHSEGGVPFTVAGRAGFEAEGGEYIFSRNTVDRLGTGLLDAINFGGAAPRMFADGGAVSRASVASSAMNQAEMAQMIGEVVASSVTQIPVVNVATETDSLSRMVQNAEAMATI